MAGHPVNDDIRLRVCSLFALLLLFNAGAWLWALATFRHDITQLGVALVVYGLGLRHAVDADHIAAIDNVTRKLVHAGQRPVTVGFWFALGHSTIVGLLAALVVGTASALGHIESLREIGGAISTVVSAGFLLAIALTNAVIFTRIFRRYRAVRRGFTPQPDEHDHHDGFLARLVRPLFRLVTRSWHMFPLGFLFGLGFDTASEVALFGLAAKQSSAGASLDVVLIFPVLFAAGMSLIDTLDGVVMLGADRWALTDPGRKLAYNLTITAISALVAGLIGLVEAMGLAAEHVDIPVGVATAIGLFRDGMGDLGLYLVAGLLSAWFVGFLFYRARTRIGPVAIADDTPPAG
jgi:high-affinity nickel-transport protein